MVVKPTAGQFYGYKHWTLEEPPRCFYVGKGLRNRPGSRCKRSTKWKAVVKRFGLRIEICLGPVSDNEAIAWEIATIAKENTFTTSYSTLGGTDVKCNFTHGGDGAAGYKHTPETAERIRLYHVGRKRSSETVQRMKDNHPMKRQEVRAKVSASKRGQLLGPQSSDHVRKRIDARLSTIARKRFRQLAHEWFKRSPAAQEHVGVLWVPSC